ncbi:prolyl endopeptidase [Endozoicomonas elysicola]|uniref:prolyl oligopeptidase n=1 Tax=Endozoicomonas elysicola TaxID=305900 RepID=A0A081KFJ0_9GAMM|nr:prolyl endopeptidase [Endozoicomonas elysicola]
MNYPVTQCEDVSENYFGTEVNDPYHWLEDDLSPEVAEWVKGENELTQQYLRQIPYRQALASVYENMLDYEKISLPFPEGRYIYFYKNTGLQNQYVLYRQKDDSEAEVFIDPNRFSDDGTVSMETVSFSSDGSLVAYSISEGGSDWQKIVVMDAETKTIMEPVLEDIKFSNIAWLGNQGFYYSSYDKPEGSALSGKTEHHKLHFHKLGDQQKNDQVIFGANDGQQYRYVTGYTTEDERFLVISCSESTSGNKLFIKDLITASSSLVTVLDHFESDTQVIDNQGDELFLTTNLGAEKGKLVRVNANDPGTENWQTVIPENSHVLSVSTGSGYLFAHYMVDALSRVFQYDHQGKRLREIQLPDQGSSSLPYGKKEATTLYYTFENYHLPTTIFAFNANSGESEIYRTSKISFDSNQYVSKQVFYRSKDGTEIPMTITHRKGIELDSSHPVMLYGYGGFDVSLMPSFSVYLATWLKLGGIYAAANLRGGGEYGKQWHDAGRRLNKQNVFDDFIAAAEYLIREKYTCRQRLSISGSSNGGLLVGAVMIQRPDLIQVALPDVGVMDMLRYHLFTAGAGWAYDYGTSEESKEMFTYLLNYSPLHNIKTGQHYPATMVTTGDHDDRVVPAHSFKFAAELQAKQSGNAPVLIRIETDAGHGAGTPMSKIIEQGADVLAFTLFNMGIKALPEGFK